MKCKACLPKHLSTTEAHETGSPRAHKNYKYKLAKTKTNSLHSHPTKVAVLIGR